MKMFPPELRKVLNKISGVQIAEDRVEQCLPEILTSCLIDTDRLALYLEALEEEVHREALYRETLDDDRLEAVLQEGLVALKDDELVHLALSPLALIDLHDSIFDI